MFSKQNSRANLIAETEEFFRSNIAAKSIACTLTLKQRVNNQSIDVEIASRNFSYFLNRLNRRVFGNATKRFDKKLAVTSVIEHNASTRFHIHCSIEWPEKYELTELCQIIRNCWAETEWGYHHTHFQEVKDSGWSDYLSKTYQKSNYDLSIDWMNFTPANR